MNWPPRLTEHPAYDSLESKCRRLLGLIGNEQEALAQDGVDLNAAQQFALEHYHRTNDLEERAATDPAARAELAAEQTRFDPVLHAKFTELVALVKRYHAASPSLAQARLYLQRWDSCVGEPRQELPPGYAEARRSRSEAEWDALWSTPVYGIPWEKLVAARQAVWDLKLPDVPLNRYLAAWTMFLCGLVHGTTYTEATGQEAEHGFDDGLREAARESWTDAVDFALDDVQEEYLRESVPVFGRKAVQQLYLAVVRASLWLPTDVAVWLRQWNESDAKLRLLVALGVRAATDDYGGRLLADVEGLVPLLEVLELRPELVEIVRGFIYRPGTE